MAGCFYLIRHARAEQAAPGGDAARGLTAEGRDSFRETVVSLAGRLQVTRLFVSPVLRARQTGDLLAALTGAPLEEEEELASGVLTGGQLLRLAEELGPGSALIGHNPELGASKQLSVDAVIDAMGRRST